MQQSAESNSTGGCTHIVVPGPSAAAADTCNKHAKLTVKPPTKAGDDDQVLINKADDAPDSKASSTTSVVSKAPKTDNADKPTATATVQQNGQMYSADDVVFAVPERVSTPASCSCITNASSSACATVRQSTSASIVEGSPAARRLRTYSIANPPMPWFGIDVGGTLTKLVYFEPTDHVDFADGTLDPGEPDRLAVVRKYLMSRRTYGETGVRDEHLTLTEMPINCRSGTLHFINFPTSRVMAFIGLVKSKGFAQLSTTACATGGGAQKFAGDIERDLDLVLHKFDELETMIVGIRYIVDHNPYECYYWQDPLDDQKCSQVPWRSNGEDCALQYPYLIVNMGSGVSILAVYGDGHYKRVSGSSIGGGFFSGLCSLLTGCKTFEEAIELATRGDSKKVDKLVRDIYGGDYSLVGLSGDAVAASFGHMIDPERRKLATPEDLARACLDTVTNNIGSIAINCARNENIQRIVFVGWAGNFLRVNPIAARRLSYAMHFWSRGHIKALFLKHEGYFGAVGCLLKLTEVQHRRRQQERESRSQSHSDSSSNVSNLAE